MCRRVWPVCMSAHHVCSVCRGQKRGSNPLELEMWMSVRHRVGAGNQTESSTRATSAEPSCPSSPSDTLESLFPQQVMVSVLPGRKFSENKPTAIKFIINFIRQAAGFQILGTVLIKKKKKTIKWQNHRTTEMIDWTMSAQKAGLLEWLSLPPLKAQSSPESAHRFNSLSSPNFKCTSFHKKITQTILNHWKQSKE